MAHLAPYRPNPRIREFPAQARRVETGPIQFGADYPGIFLRGDTAFGYAMNLRAILEDSAETMEALDRMSLLSLLEELDSCYLVQKEQQGER